MDTNSRSEDGYDSPGGSSSSRNNYASPQPDLYAPRQLPGRPNYMTVGHGSTSESAARLAAILDDDSGYAGSIANDSSTASGWNPGITGDHPTPSHTPGMPVTDQDRQVVASHILQLYYNKNRTALSRAIQRTIDTLEKLQQMNADWPAHYPQVQRTGSSDRPSSSHQDPRPGLHHTQSTLDNHYENQEQHPCRPAGPRRAGTSLGEDRSDAESSALASQRPVPEPRLVDPQLAQELAVLKIDLKLGSLSQTELVHSLEKKSIAQLLGGQISKSIRHLCSLRERIEDTSSKVLVTGDLNAGKSTFCNALLRRKVLPEDQQPCTEIFCEVLDVRENDGREEVHAIPIGVHYDRRDERTYKVFSLKELEDIVTDSSKWSQCKIYIRDVRGVEESLLNNSIVDIALIDAPGLNNDSLKTTAVFARQEEIDVVVFVVSAANHFTQSAKEFIFSAAREKAYIFMVVNGFDTIKAQERCQRMILEQVRGLSPATFKESAELVHFVSSNAIPVVPADMIPGGSGGGSGSGFEDPSGGPDGDDGDDPSEKHGEPGSPPKGKGKAKEKQKMRDFEILEQSLRRFVLEKRSRSKLAPAKTYLMNLLGDVNSLAGINEEVAGSEFDRVTRELEQLEPEYEQSKQARTAASEEVDHTIEETATEVYSYTREKLNESIDEVSVFDFGIDYPGFLSAYSYAEDLKAAMLDHISYALDDCEEHARQQVSLGFNGIKNLGILHLGDQFANMTFHPDRMFRTRRHALARQVEVDVEPWDFFDFASIWERQEKMAGTSMVVTVAGVVGTRMIGGVSWVDGVVGAVKVMGANNVRRMIVPGMIAAVALAIAYAVSSIPHSLPHRLSNKLSAQLDELDYIHSNALRLSSEVRKALKIPAEGLRVELQRKVEDLREQKEKTTKFREEAHVARKYFANLVRDSNDIRHNVDRVDLEGPAPGVAAAMDY